MSQIRKKAELEIKVAAYQHRLHPVCQVCGEAKPLRLHHILRKSLYVKHKIIDLMPTIFHALICDKCNMNQGPYPVDNPEGRAIMLAQNAHIFGGLIELAREAFIWDNIVSNGWNNDIVDLDRVREIYDLKYNKHEI